MKYIKYLLLSIIITAGVSYTLYLIDAIVVSQKYIFAEFTPSIEIILVMGILGITTVLALSAKDWWFTYFIFPLTVALPGAFFVKSDATVISAAVVAGILLMNYGIIESKRTYKMLVRVDANLITKPTINAFVTYASIMAAIIVVAGNNIPDINIGKMVNDKVGPSIKQNIQKQIDNKVKTSGIDNLNLGEDSFLSNIISQYGMPDVSNIGSDVVSGIDIEKQVNDAVQPYSQFILPVFALLAFAFIKFLGFFSEILSTMFLGAFYALMKKTNILKTEEVTVIKEEAYL